MNAVAQRDAARERANEIRMTCAAERRRIRAFDLTGGMLAVADLIERNEHPYNAVRLEWMPRAVRRFGPVRLERLCARIGASSQRRIRDLTDRQRRVLVDELRRGAGR